MKTIELNGVKYKLVPLTVLDTPPSKEHDLFVEILDASQRRAEGDPQWKMTDAQWCEHWGVECPVSDGGWAERRRRYGPTGHEKAYERREGT